MNGTAAEEEVPQTITAFFRRIFWCDFRSERAVGWESRSLQRRGLAHPLVQAYAAWRWPLLAMAIPLLLFQGIWDLATFTWSTASVKEIPEGQRALEVIGTASFDLFDAFRLLGIISILIGAVMMAMAVGFWSRVRTSRTLALIGWLIMFAVPFLLAIFPHASLMNLEQLDAQNPQAASLVKKAMGMLFALMTALALGPRIFALLPGMIRSSLTLKTLLPESSATGWLTAIFAPLWAAFLLLALVVTNQFQVSLKLVFGLMFLLMAPLVFVIRARAIIRPCRAAELAKAVLWPRRIATLINLTGVVLLVWTFFEMGGVGSVFAFVLGALANILVLSVVASDFMLPLLRWSFQSGQDFQSTDLRPALEQKYQAFLPARPAIIEAARAVVEAKVVPPAPEIIDLKVAETPPKSDTSGGKSRTRTRKSPAASGAPR